MLPFYLSDKKQVNKSQHSVVSAYLSPHERTIMPYKKMKRMHLMLHLAGSDILEEINRINEDVRANLPAGHPVPECIEAHVEGLRDQLMDYNKVYRRSLLN